MGPIKRGPATKPSDTKYRHIWKPTTYNTKSHRYIRPKTFCNTPHINAHLNPPLPHHRTWHILYTLTNPNYQPYQKCKFSGITTVPYEHVPLETPGTLTDIRMNCMKLAPSKTNGLPPTNHARPMHCTNGRKHHHRKHLNGTTAEHHHKANCGNPIGNSINLPQTINTSPITMSSNDDNVHAGA